MVFKLFTAHPQNTGQSYAEHMGFAASVGFKLILAGLAALTHAVFPFVLQTTTSRLTREVYQTIFDHRAGEAAERR